eukprot:g3602.t1
MPKVKPAVLAAAKKDLPPHWEARDVNGRVVYINHNTRTTQWEKPKHSLSNKKPAKGRNPPAAAAPAATTAGSTAKTARASSTRARGSGGSKMEPLTAEGAGAISGASVSPDAKRGPAGATSRGMTSPLPAGWESKIIDGKVVYIDHANQTTTFERPTSRAPGSLKQARSMEGPLSARRANNGPSPTNVEKRSQSLRNPRGTGAYPSGDADTGGEELADPIYASNATAQKFSSGDSPLPQGWGRSVTKNGELYYVNHVTKTTTWSRPQWTGSDGDDESVHEDEPGVAASNKSARSGRSVRSRHGDALPNVVESAEPPLPPGWEERMSAEGKVFYINHNDRTTHWTRPDPPPVQPDDSPAEDLPPSDARGSTESWAPAAGKDESPLPTNGRADDAGASPALSGGSNGGYGGAAAYAEDAVAHYDDEEGEEAAQDPPRAAAAAAAEAEAEAEAVTLEEVAGASFGSTGVDVDPKVAPSATVVADAAVEESTSRSMGASPATSSGAAAATAAASTAFVTGEEEANKSLEAVTPSAGDDPTAAAVAEEEGDGVGRAGPVSSIVKSGLFGATVVRPGGSGPIKGGTGGGGGTNGESAGSATKKSNSVVPNYASSATGNLKVPANVAAGAAGAREAGKPKPVVDVNALPEGWMELKTPEGKVYYQNSISKTTQWARPAPPKADTTATQLNTANHNSTRSAPAGGGAVEAGWEKVMTGDGRPYYQNTLTKKTSWLPPEGWVEPGAAAAAATEAETAGAAAHGTFFKSSGAAVDVEGLGVEATEEAPAATVAPTPIGRVARGTPISTAREAVPEAEAQEAPLPPGWEKLYTEDGVPFWTNHNERTTSWDPPSPPAGAVAVVGVVSEAQGTRSRPESNSEVFESVDGVEAVAIGVAVGNPQMTQNLGADGRPLPEGWEMQTTDQGVPYYVDHINKRTSWDPPIMSSGGMSVLASAAPDIPPAELVPDSADLYMGADLLNRFFGSWMGDAQGKSPLEAARNVVVTYLTGPGLKVNKCRNGTNVQRFLYLSPTNKQVVWATKATSKGKLSKKGLTLDGITELHSEASGIRVEARGEATPLILKSAAVDSLTSEGATILLGVLLADMTGTMLKLQGVNGGSGSCYYPASFVNDVLAVRRARMEKNAALAAAATSHQVASTPRATVGSNGSSAKPEPEPAATPVAAATATTAASNGASHALSAAGVAASYMAHLSKGSQKALKSTASASDGRPSSSFEASAAGAGAGAGAAAAAAAPTVTSDYPKTLEIAVSGEDEDTDSTLPKDDLAAGAASASEEESAKVAATSTPAAEEVPASAPETKTAVQEAVKSEVEPKVEPAAVAVEAAEGPAEGEEDEETREYKEVLIEMLRPVKLEQYVENFLASGITLDILPLVERGDLQSEVGINGAVHQLKIMKAIKTRFPNGV